MQYPLLRSAEEKSFHTIQQLEALLNFRFLPQIAFESREDRQEILCKGLDKFRANQVSLEAQQLGASHIHNIEAAYLPHVSLRFLSGQVGHGLFAEEEICSGDYAGEYTGVVRKNDRRYTEPLNNYCYEYPVADSIGRNYVIDATQGNLTRFINHSEAPNLRPIHVFYEGFYHLIFIALCRIEKGTQLSYDYGRNYWYLRSPPCTL